MIRHACHARNCFIECPPAHLMCARHWAMVPRDLQREVWRWYAPGQENTKRVSPEWLRAARNAIDHVAALENGKVLLS
jgi:hypothetical protein